MALFDKVRTVELLRGGDVNTYTATGVSGSEQYLLHWLPPDGTPALARVLKTLDDLPREARSMLLELGSREGKAYLITGHPATFTTLEEWLQSVHALFAPAKPDLEKKGVWRVPGAVASTPARPEVGGKLEQGEAATREMTAYGWPSNPPNPPSVAPVALPSIPQASGFAISGGLKEAGEFTRMMNMPNSPSTPSAPSTPSSPSTPPALPKALAAKPEIAGLAAPGEFTRLFVAQGHQLVPPDVEPEQVAEPPKPGAGPGEFTRLFSAQPPMVNPATPVGVPSVATSFKPSGNQPGEFTRLMNAGPVGVPPPAPALPSVPAPQPPVPSRPGEFTRLMSASQAPPPAASPQFAPPAPLPAASEPGEFTRLLQSPLAQSPSTRPQDVSQEYDRMFGAQAGRQQTPAMPTPQAPQVPDPVYGATRLFNAPPSAPKVETPMGPSEYTRMMAASPSSRVEPPAAAPAKPAAAAKPAANPKKKDQMTLLAVLAVLAIFAIALIAYFALAK